MGRTADHPTRAGVRLRIAAWALYFASASSTGARTWHVNADGTGDVPTIADAVAAAAAGDTVEIACGLYRNPAIAAGIDLVFRSETGAPGCVELDGEGVGRPLRVFGASTVTVEGLNFQGGSGVPGGAILVDGGRLISLSCVFSANQSSSGGAIFARSDLAPSELVLRSSEFRDNTVGVHRRLVAGAAVRAGPGTVVLAEQCTFERNHVFEEGVRGLRGGALAVSGCSDVRVSGCVFRDNAAHIGGAISADTSLVLIDECRFEFNQAVPGYGFGSYAGVGGALALRADEGTRVTNSTFNGNSAVNGGAVWIRNSSAVVQLVDSRIEENTSDVAGALQVRDAPVRLAGCAVLSNESRAVGGIHSIGATLAIERAVIARNRGLAERGGGVLAIDSDVSLDQVTFHANRCEGPGSGLFYAWSDVQVSRSIFAFSAFGTALGCEPGSDPPHVSCTDIFGNAGGDWVECVAGMDAIDRNFSLDPLFCDAAAGDFAVGRFSPCAAPGFQECGQVGALGAACGPVSVQSMSWGRLKSLYR